LNWRAYSVVGLLQFATKVVRPGRPFLCRHYIHRDVGNQPDHLVRLTLPAKADILWWYIFVDALNGILLLFSPLSIAVKEMIPMVIAASHIPWVKNVAADALSANVLFSFCSQVPQADPHPMIIFPHLISQDITWTCNNLIKQFKDTLKQV